MSMDDLRRGRRRGEGSCMRQRVAEEVEEEHVQYRAAARSPRPSGWPHRLRPRRPQPLDPQNWSFQDNLTWARLQEAARAGLLGPEHPADGQEVEGRARSSPTSRTARSSITQPAGSTIFGTPTATAHSVPREQVAAVLRRLPQQAVGAEQLPDHEPVLDGGLLRQVRRRARRRSARTRCRCNAYQYFISAYAGTTAEHRTARRRTGRRRATATSAPTCARRWAADVGEATDRRRSTTSSAPSAGQDQSSTWQEFGEMQLHRARTPSPTRSARRPTTRCKPATGRRPATSRGPRGPRPRTSGRAPAATARPRPRAPAWPSTPTSSRTT